MSTESGQDSKNHRRYVFGYHVVATVLVSGYALYAIYALVTDFSAASAFKVILAAALLLIGYYAREFALGNQDRIIRLEERLRLTLLLPDHLRAEIEALTTDQLIALRFASDEELPEVARKVIADRISDREAIKKLIKNWRPDNQRI